MSVLFVFSHPDDEILAAGGTLMKFRHGNNHVLFLSTGVFARQGKRKQQLSDLRTLRKNAISILTGDTYRIPKMNIHFENYPDNQADTYPLLSMIRTVEDYLEVHKPGTIFTHHRYCTNIDHQYCHQAVVTAARPKPNQETINILCGEVPSSTGYLRPAQWEPNYYIQLSKKNLTAKIDAMQRYEKEKRESPHPRSPQVLEALARVRGAECGCEFAEAFMAQRIVA